MLIEGPPEANGVLAAVGEAGLKPPVALLVYATERPEAAGFYPFAEFSPEWQAVRYANEAGVPVRCIDLAAGSSAGSASAWRRPWRRSRSPSRSAACAGPDGAQA